MLWTVAKGLHELSAVTFGDHDNGWNLKNLLLFSKPRKHAQDAHIDS